MNVRILTTLTTIIAFLALLMVVPQAQAASSPSLELNPVPPFAVTADGTDILSIQGKVTFDSTPVRVDIEVRDNANAPIVGTGCVQSINLTGQASPYTSPVFQCVIPVTAAPGPNARVYIDYYCMGNTLTPATCDAGGVQGAEIENTANRNFIISAAPARLNVTKFEDLNGNGTREAGEPGLAGWVFTATDTNNTSVTATTDANGVAEFLHSQSTTLTVAESLVPGWAATGGVTQRVVPVTAGQTATVAFGNYRPGTICGTLYRDVDVDGVRDADETDRFAGQKVTLGLNTTNGLANATTDANGNYCFTGVAPAVGYHVTAPANVTSGEGATGDADGPSNGISFIGNITMVSGGAVVDRDFGYVGAILQLTKQVASVSNSTPATAGEDKTPATTDEEDTPAPTTAPVLKDVEQGGTVTWKIVVTNTGRATVTGLKLTDPLLRDSVVVSAGGGTLKNGVITWALADLAPGASKTITLVTKFNADARLGVATNTARVTAANAAPRSAQARVNVIENKVVVPNNAGPRVSDVAVTG